MPKPRTPLLAVDPLIIYKSKLILFRRKKPPFQDQLAIPGGSVKVGETTENACVRVAKEKTNMDVKITKLIGVFSDPKRDPRGHTISIAYLCEPLTEVETPLDTLEIVPIAQHSLQNLAFDHNEMIRASGILK